MPEDPFDFGSYRTPAGPAAGASPTRGSASQDPFGSAPPAPGRSGDPFADGPAARAGSGGGARPPLLWLWLAVGLAVVGLALAVPSVEGVLLYVAGWALGGPIAITVLTIFARKDTVAQTAPFYTTDAWIPRVYRATFALCLLTVVACSLRLGHWAGYR